ncbi:MAG: hypothetical protein IKM81_03365 [Fibrobacter sp.]|nr:hypothetical protein [Fibrobacter sp.]
MNFKACSAVISSAFAISLMLAACGSDDNSSNVERGDDDSSSSVEESSSSTEKSSSSKEADGPKGTRAATLEDLEKNMSLGEMFGTELFLAAGAKQGVFSLWISDPAWIAVRSEFKDGVIEFGVENGSFMGVESKSADKMQAFFEKSGELKFIVNEKEQLQVSINGGKFKDVESVSVEKESGVITNAGDLKGVKLSCKSGTLKQVYSFFKDRYVVEETDGDSTNWSAGYYDIQRGYLLMLPVFFDKSVYSLVSAEVDSDFNMSIVAGDDMSCSKSTLKYKDVDRSKLVGTWVAYEDNYKWSLKLDSLGNHNIEVTLKKAQQEKRSGIWDVYGDQLLMKNTNCSINKDSGRACGSAVKGSVEKLDPEKGFTYKHNDVGTMPTEWSLPEYE